MWKSTIDKHAAAGPRSRFAVVLGREIQRRRRELGVSQAAVGAPMGRSFVSRVEHGHVTPSLASLVIIAGRLDTSVAAILAAVESRLETEGADGADDRETLTRRS